MHDGQNRWYGRSLGNVNHNRVRSRPLLADLARIFPQLVDVRDPRITKGAVRVSGGIVAGRRPVY